MGHTVSNLDSQLTLSRAAADNGIGTGYIVASGDTVTWQAPEDTAAGTAVTIEDGETKKVYASGSTTKWILVARSGTDAMSGTATVILDGKITPTERLIEVQSAITRSLKAINSRDGDVSIERENLKNLRALEKELKAEIATEAGSTPRSMRPDFRRSLT